MVRLVDIQNDYGTEIADIIDDLTVLTPLNHLSLSEIFSNEELTELRKSLVEVKAATSENEKTAKLLEQGDKILKLMQKLGFAI